MRRRRAPEIIAGRVNADGSIAAGDGFTVQKTGTGTYTVYFNQRNFRPISAVACPAQSISAYCTVQSLTEAGFAMASGTVGATPVAVDTAFHFVAAGIQQ